MTQNTKYDKFGKHNILALDASTEQTQNILSESGGMRVVTLVWDTNTLSVVRMEQPATADDLGKLLESYYKDTRYAYDDVGNVQYIGNNISVDASTSATDWVITKYSYASGSITRRQCTTGSWDNRGGLF